MSEQSATTISSYERIGSEEGLWKLVNTFYDNMETLPEARTIRELHANDLRSAREKLFMFLSGWLGGPGQIHRSLWPSKITSKASSLSNW